MFLSGLFSLIAKLFFFTGRIDKNNTFEKPLSVAAQELYDGKLISVND